MGHSRTRGDTTEPMSIYDDLWGLSWPESFIVVWRDGASERLLRGEGIDLLHPNDDPDGLGAMMATVPKRHPQNQKTIGRYIRFDELDRILDEDGTVVYRVR